LERTVFTAFPPQGAAPAAAPANPEQIQGLIKGNKTILAELSGESAG
jgi:hypothetical protein